MTNDNSKKQELDFIKQINEKYKKEQQCFDQVIVKGKDWHGKKTTISWPRDKPQGQVMYEQWLGKVTDPDTGGEYYHQRDKDGNIIKATGPKHLIKQIVRIRTSDDKEYLYSNGYVLGYDVMGDPVREICSNPETWQKTDFEYKREYDPKSGAVKSIPVGPNNIETIYEMPFNEKNVKALFDKRITPEYLKLLRQNRITDISFTIKDQRSGVVREVKDVTGILSKSLELFMKPFDYLANSEYISPQIKQELRQRAIDQGVLPPAAQEGQHLQIKPPTGTYS